MNVICRTCLSYGESFDVINMKITPINLRDSSHLTVSDVLKIMCSNLDLNEEHDALPNTMCRTCFKTLRLAFDFRKKSKESEITLKIKLEKDLHLEAVLNEEAEDNSLDPLMYGDETSVKSDTKTESLDYHTISSLDIKPTHSSFKEDEQLFDYEDIIEELDYEDEIKESEVDQTKSTENTLTCEHCQKTFGYKCTLKRHRRVQHPELYPNLLAEGLKLRMPAKKSEENYPCPICNKIYAYKHSVTKHIRIEHVQKKLEARIITNKDDLVNGEHCPCPYCDKVFKWSQSLKKHIILEHSDTIVLPETSMDNTLTEKSSYKFVCKICNDESSSTLDELRQHLADEHNSLNTIYGCIVCADVFESRRQLITHRKLHLKEIVKTKGISCRICGHKVNFIDKLHAHMKIYHNASSTLVPKKIGCSICHRKFDSSLRLEKHKKVYENDVYLESLFCKICNIKTTSLCNMELHMQQIHDRKLTCDICSSEFKAKRYLEKHMLVHSGIRKYKCKYCNKSFTQSNILDTHVMGIHTGKKCLCPDCGKSFARPSILNRHINSVHKGLRQYSCDKCAHTFISKSHLNHHLAQHHASGKHFQCEICQKTYFCQAGLSRHILTHKKPYLCHICPYGSIQRTPFHNHLRMEHNIFIDKNLIEKYVSVEHLVNSAS